MASQQHDTVFEDIDDDEDEFHEYEEDEEDDDVLVDDEETDPPSSSRSVSVPSVTVAVPGSVISNGAIRPPILTPTATTIVFPADSFPSDSKRQQQLQLQRIDQIEEKKPLEDSRKLFQRLWTDEDEMELLQGFLDYTSQRGSSHHNDTAQFYDQIKSKLQLDFNKNQLVEKIRRLKKKYRNVLNKISSGKEFVFKTAHDQATFEISRKIWNNVAPVAGDIAIDEDEINLNPSPNPNLNFSPVILKTEANSNTRKRSRPRSVIRTFEKRESIEASNSIRDRDYLNINLNNPNPNPIPIHIPNPNPIPNPYITATTTATTTVNAAITPNITATPIPTIINANNYSTNCSSIGTSVAGVIEETVRSCLSPLLKELVAGAGGSAMGGSVGGGRGGFGGFAMNPLPFQFMNSGFGGGEIMDEKWRKQQILELEVYSKRLELVQDQIKASLDELRGSGG
ncbi:probable transcription factor At5g28040 [Vicia villosa]|uniref:probable transcription factor At5g28040 n=1 Tax=Vicia villosa TaxID=3911 RepID=UPI00273CDFC4|nr:probable transcription factor At5g28040 [Vicia villosa]